MVDMKSETSSFWFIALVIVSIWFYRDYQKQQKEIAYLNNEVSSLEDEKSSYSDALDQANSNIEDAQSSAWSSYDDMGYALDNLETVNP